MMVRERASAHKVGCIDITPLIELFHETGKRLALTDLQRAKGLTDANYRSGNDRGYTAIARILAADDPVAAQNWRKFIERAIKKDADGNPAPMNPSVHVDIAEHICHALGVMPHHLWPDYLAVSEEWVDHLLAKDARRARKCNRQLSLLEAS